MALMFTSLRYVHRATLATRTSHYFLLWYQPTNRLFESECAQRRSDPAFQTLVNNVFQFCDKLLFIISEWVKCKVLSLTVHLPGLIFWRQNMWMQSSSQIWKVSEKFLQVSICRIIGKINDQLSINRYFFIKWATEESVFLQWNKTMGHSE